MGRANDLKAFQNNADGFICSLLPGISHPQVQYSPGIYIIDENMWNHGLFGASSNVYKKTKLKGG